MIGINPHNRVTNSRHEDGCVQGQKQTRSATEQVHAELFRLATEVELVRGQTQTECNALRDSFARTTAAMGSSQHDRRLNHKEADRNLPQQFGGNRVDYGDFAFRMEGYAAVLSHDGQGGALLREVAKLDRFESDTIETLEKRY